MSSLPQAQTKRLLPDAAEFSPGLLAIQESPMPKLPRLIFYIVAVLFTILLAWAIFAKVDVVAVADGKLVPVSYTKIVQPAEAGVVADILVKEGDQVQAGQVLIRLDPTMTGADSRSLASELSLKRLTLRRVDAELAGIPLAIKDGDDPVMIAQVQAQANAHRQAFTDSLAQEVATRERAQNELRSAQETLTKLKSTLPSYEQSAKAHSKLVAEGFLSPIAGNDKEREAIEKSQDLKAQAATVQGLLSTITAQDKKIAGLSSTFRSQLLIERTGAMGQLAKLEQDTQKMGYKTGLLELKAPQAGIVKDVATTSKGAVVQPGNVERLTLTGSASINAVGNALNNRIEGNAGNNILFGGLGSDTYVWGRGSGQDIIVNFDAGKPSGDTVQLGADIAEADLGIFRHGNDLILSVNGTTDQLSVANYFENAGKGANALEKIRFADGISLNHAAVLSRTTLEGGVSDAQALSPEVRTGNPAALFDAPDAAATKTSDATTEPQTVVESIAAARERFEQGLQQLKYSVDEQGSLSRSEFAERRALPLLWNMQDALLDLQLAKNAGGRFTADISIDSRATRDFGLGIGLLGAASGMNGRLDQVSRPHEIQQFDLAQIQ